MGLSSPTSARAARLPSPQKKQVKVAARTKTQNDKEKRASPRKLRFRVLRENNRVGIGDFEPLYARSLVETQHLSGTFQKLSITLSYKVICPGKRRIE